MFMFCFLTSSALPSSLFIHLFTIYSSYSLSQDGISKELEPLRVEFVPVFLNYLREESSRCVAHTGETKLHPLSLTAVTSSVCGVEHVLFVCQLLALIELIDTTTT